MPHVLIGEITNHTHHLAEARIHEIVEQWVLAHGGPEAYGRVGHVHAAPAEDPKVLTKATRAWRNTPAPREDFTQYEGHKLYWFGFSHGQDA